MVQSRSSSNASRASGRGRRPRYDRRPSAGHGPRLPGVYRSRSPRWPLGPVEYGFGDEIPPPIGVRLIALGPVRLEATPLVTGQALEFDNSALLFELTDLANLIEVRISLSGIAQVRVVLNGSPINITHPRDLIGNPMLVGEATARVEEHMQDSTPYETLVIEGRIGSVLIDATEARLEALCVTTSTQTGARGP